MFMVYAIPICLSSEVLVECQLSRTGSEPACVHMANLGVGAAASPCPWPWVLVLCIRGFLPSVKVSFFACSLLSCPSFWSSPPLSIAGLWCIVISCWPLFPRPLAIVREIFVCVLGVCLFQLVAYFYELRARSVP